MDIKMDITTFILNNEEKKEMLEALKESEALKYLYNNKEKGIKIIISTLVKAKNRNIIKLYKIKEADPNFEKFLLGLAEGGIKTYINSYLEEMEEKPSDAVIMYFIKMYIAFFYLYYDNTYLKKMNKGLIL